MVLQIDDWYFKVFEVATRKYYAKRMADHCDCAWCRNFYAAVDNTYPELRNFLDGFGVRPEAPTEIMSFTPTMSAEYYAVCGEILDRGEEKYIEIDGLRIEPLTAQEAMVNCSCQEPVFFLYVPCKTLPWVLEEPMEEAQSPAKGKAYVQRLLQRWISDPTPYAPIDQ